MKRKFLKHVVMMACVLLSNTAIASSVLIKNISELITGRSSGDGNIEALHNTDLLIEDGVIKEIGPGLSSKSDTKVINALGKILQPGFVDTHDHLWQVSIRGCGNHQELFAWLTDCDFVQTDITHKEGFAAVRLATYDLINTGVTTVMDWNHTFSTGQAYGGLDALQQSGLRYVFGFYPHNEEEFDQNAGKIKAIVDKNPLGSFMIVSHPANFMEASMAKAVQISQDLDVPLNVHYGESTLDKQIF